MNSEGEKENQGDPGDGKKKNKESSRGEKLAKSSIAFITADIAVPKVTDAAWPKWAGYAVVGGIAGVYLYQQSDVVL